MKMKLIAILFSAGFCMAAAGRQSEFAIGRAYYAAGSFKKAAVHFQLAVQSDPSDAKAYYWSGMSYEMLADIAAPLGRGRYNTKARRNLTKAMELAPHRLEYRRELFEFLLDSAAWRQAEAIVRMVPESDPESVDMRRRLEEARHANSSAEARLGRLFLAGPQTADRLTAVSQSALSTLSGRGSSASVR